MTENQKLREALQHAIEDLSSATGFLTRRSRDRQSKTVAALAQLQADIALPTADHLPDAGEMVNGLTKAETDASASVSGLTAAPVGELPELPEPFALSVSVHEGDTPAKTYVECQLFQKHPNEKQKLYTDDQMRAYARAALSAGDAGWQPIETAPKDGSDCWLLVDGDVRRGFWVEIEFEERRDMDGRYIDQTDADAYWMDHDSGDSLEPTMFYPITKPLPPSLVDIDAAIAARAAAKD